MIHLPRKGEGKDKLSFYNNLLQIWNFYDIDSILFIFFLKNVLPGRESG
jgi:hypothetical protein